MYWLPPITCQARRGIREWVTGLTLSSGYCTHEELQFLHTARQNHKKDVKQVCEPQLDENKSELLRKRNPRLENTVFDSKGDCITVS